MSFFFLVIYLKINFCTFPILFFFFSCSFSSRYTSRKKILRWNKTRGGKRYILNQCLRPLSSEAISHENNRTRDTSIPVASLWCSSGFELRTGFTHEEEIYWSIKFLTLPNHETYSYMWERHAKMNKKTQDCQSASGSEGWGVGGGVPHTERFPRECTASKGMGEEGKKQKKQEKCKGMYTPSAPCIHSTRGWRKRGSR